MTSPLVAKWTAKLAAARKQLEDQAAAGDEKAKAILRELKGEVQPKVNATIPGPPPRPWCDTDREPGEDDE